MRLPLDSPAVSELQSKLGEIPSDTPHYWEFSGALVSYKSAGGKPEFPATPWKGKCGELSAKVLLVSPLNGARRTGTMKGMVIENCEADLDAQTFVENVTLLNCIIRYSGGPLKLSAVRFLNCIFLFKFQNAPKGDGSRLAQTLMVNQSTATVVTD